MSVFQHYARYYDLLYRDKNYAAEAVFLQQLIQAHAPAAKSVFELGCGTGKHAVEFARLGYRCGGIDLSGTMIAGARALYAAQPPELAARLSAGLGDVRTYRTPEQFDAVLSLFHVINYQTTSADLAAAMATAAALTKPGGVFCFDFWYGPAVLSDPPAVRVRRMEDEVIAVTRLAEPVLHVNANQVDVNYEVFAREKATGAVSSLKETHHMRYLFLPEITELLAAAGFTLLTTGAWMSARPLDAASWYGYAVSRRTTG